VAIRRGLGGLEARTIADLAAEGKTLFTLGDLQAKLGSRLKARKMASKLVKKQWLERLARGVYLVLELSAGSRPKWTEDRYYIASKLASPCYIGFYNALHKYAWTEQVPLVVNTIVTSPLKNRVIHGVEYRFIAVTKRKFFGRVKIVERGHEIEFSDPEKTIVDALDRPEYCGGMEEVAKALFIAKETLDFPKVVSYAERSGNGAVLKRLGFLCEMMGVPLSGEIVRRIKLKATKGYALLSPRGKREGRHSSRWGLLVNVDLTKEKALA